MSHSAALLSLSLTSDEELACRAQGGCQASFEQLLRRFQTPVLHFLRHRGLAADAEDICQETFLRAYKNLHRYNRRWPFSAWLFTITRRLCINHHRRQKPNLDITIVEATASADPEPLDALVRAEARQQLWDIAKKSLSEEQSTALWLHYVEEMPIQGIGLVLKRSTAAVKVLLFRARRKLLPYMEEHDGHRRRGSAVAFHEASYE